MNSVEYKKIQKKLEYRGRFTNLPSVSTCKERLVVLSELAKKLPDIVSKTDDGFYLVLQDNNGCHYEVDFKKNGQYLANKYQPRYLNITARQVIDNYLAKYYAKFFPVDITWKNNKEDNERIESYRNWYARMANLQGLQLVANL